MRIHWIVLAALVVFGGCANRPRWEADTGHRESTEKVEAAQPAVVPPAPQPQERPPLRSSGVGPEFLRFPVGGDQVVGQVGDEELRKSQVFDYMLKTFPDKVRAAIAVMISNRVLAAECEKHSITVAESEVSSWYAGHSRMLRDQARAEMGGDDKFEEWMKLRFGQTSREYEKVARDRERAKRLLSRLVRYHEILEDRVRFRIISVVDRDLSRRLRKMLDEGADFATLAKSYSIHPSAEQGGLMHPVWRLALNPALDAAAFGLPVGAISPVVEARDDRGRARYQIVRVVERKKGRAVRYAEVEDEIASGLLERPLSQDEWLMWQVKVERLASIELALP